MADVPIFGAVKKKINIAIDGYSSCGKSTMAKALAKKLHYAYIDSGAMYRALTLYAINAGLAESSGVKAKPLIAILDKIDIAFENHNGQNLIKLNQVAVEGEIRSMPVSSAVSHVSKIPEVRKKLQELQQKMAARGGVVMDGRDIGSAVLPNAELKIFMTADNKVRAQRRYDELAAKGISITLAEVKENLAKRDRIDTTRKENPLIQVADAKVLDSTHLTPAQQLEIALTWAQEAIGALG